jgi:hypothetical protein
LAAVTASVLLLTLAGCSSPSGTSGNAQLAWSENILIPGDFCGILGAVHVVHHDSWAISIQSGRVEIGVSTRDVVYGDLLGNGSKAAALHVSCTTGGGTAASQLGEEYAVFDQSIEPPKFIGAVVPQQPSDPDVHPTIFGDLSIQPGRVVVHERWYHSDDPDCCPSGKATTTWTFHGGRLLPGKPVVS